MFGVFIEVAKMLGYFDREKRPRITVSVIGNRAETSVDALIDTGFDGALHLPISIAIPLGLELHGDVRIELADGTVKHELTFLATIKLGGVSARKEVTLTEFDTPLLGSEILEDYVLEIYYVNRTVKIRKPSAQAQGGNTVA